jgi:uncharacterized protein YkwD
MRLFPIGQILLLALLVCCWGKAQADEPEKKSKLELSSEEKALLELTNKERARKKLPPLEANATLCKLARDHSANMARKKEMSHVHDGKTPRDRLEASGYEAAAFGENIAWSSEPGAKVAGIVDWWMHSKDHRGNILNPDFQEIGLGAVRVDKETLYCTQVFARPQARR